MVVLENNTSGYLEYKGVQGGWLMEQGTEYYIGVVLSTTSWNGRHDGDKIRQEKELADMGLVGG